MKLLHCGDIHLSELPGPVINGANARMIDTVKCMDFLAETAEKETPDAILLAGDLFHKSKLWADPMLEQIAIATEWLRKLSLIAPTVLMFGTSTHDSLQAFENIQTMRIDNLIVITNPFLFNLDTKAGPLQIAAVPGLDKGYFRTKYPGMDPAEENQKCSELLGDVVLGLGAQVDPSIPSVLMAHYSVAGCEYDNGQQHIFTQNEVILPREAIAASPFDLVCLGHIHKAQEVEHCGRPVFYSGAINGLTFNEEGQDKGFWMHELRNDPPWDGVDSRFIKTPYREFLTRKWDEQNIEIILDYIGENPTRLMGTIVKDKIIRVHYSCSEEQNKQLNRKALEKDLYDAGAFYVAEIKPLQINIALTKQELTENAGPLENLRAWCKAEGFPPEETLALEVLARPLIDTVSAKMPTGKLSGVFVPRRLKVRNYRSYISEEIDFTKITFATVNGENGIGKSALFMDAPCDCLFEEPRSGVTGSWITTGQLDGAIEYEFSMGESIWRVNRVRSIKGAGKISLALSELVNGEWVPRGGTKAPETQKIIESLIGMDVNTFRCVGLIMQDNYGLFMEADKSERMKVFGRVLGLVIYEALEKLAKEKVTETNRELQKAKDKLAELDEKLKAKPGLEVELAQVGTEIAKLTGDIAGMETELKEAEELVRSLEVKAQKAEELRQQIEDLDAEIIAKIVEKKKQHEQLGKANSMLLKEKDILAKATEYEQVKERIATLKAKQPQLTEYGKEESRIAADIERTEAVVRRQVPQIRDLEALLANRAAMEKAAAEYLEATVALKDIAAIGKKHREYTDQVMAIERVTDKMAEPLTGNYEQLKTCREKVEILNNSNCIDPEKASCRFLADAVKSKGQIPILEAEIEEILNQRRPLDEQVKAIEEEQDALKYDCREHSRLEKLVEELRPKAEQAAQLNVKAELLANLQEQKRQREEGLSGHTERLASVKELIRQLSMELEPLPALEARLPKLKDWVKAKDELPAARQIVVTATERIAALDREIQYKEDAKLNLILEKNSLELDATDLPTQKSLVGSLRIAIDRMREDQNKLHGLQGGLKTKLETLATDEEERGLVSKIMAPTVATLTRYQTLAKAFGQDGIPFSIVRAAIPELEATANSVLQEMTHGKMSMAIKLEQAVKSTGQEKPSLEIIVTDWRGSRPYLDYSGAQKVQASLSGAFALSDLKKRRGNIQLGFLFIDEPPFLSAASADAYINAVETAYHRNQGMKIVVITHDPAMKSRFPQQIDVEDLGEEGSKVRLVA